MIRLLAMLLAAATVARAQEAPPVPVPQLPGQGRPVDIGATRARRERLLKRVGTGLVVVRAAPARDLEEQVLQDSDFRQDDDFFYLTMLETPDAWLILVGGPSGPEAHLFLPARQRGQERWTGLRLGPGAGAGQ